MSKKHHTISAIETAYIAGFFDGEGCVRIEKRHFRRDNSPLYTAYSICARIANTNRDILAWIQAAFGGSIYCGIHRSRDKQGAYKVPYELVFSRQAETQAFLLAIAPYMRVRKAQVLLGLEFIALGNGTKPSLRDQCYERMKRLNRKGQTNYQMVLNFKEQS